MSDIFRGPAPENARAESPSWITRGRAHVRRRASLPTLALIGCLCIAAGPVTAQYRTAATGSPQADLGVANFPQHPKKRGPSIEAVGEHRDRTPSLPASIFGPGNVSSAPRVEFPGGEVMLRQSTAGLIGGVAGALAILLPLAAADRGGSEVGDDAMTVGALLGFIGGSAVGVQYYSNRQGMYGSWWGTLGGAAFGALGGPILVVTVPAGAMAGFNLTREN